MSEFKESELPKAYSSKEVEAKWYDIWEKGGYFKPRKGKQNKTYSIVMPPPNVTGKLHAGHALDVTTQDALIRFKRMKGFETLYLPGMDHAGIATQSVVEQLVYKQEKKTRHDFTREEFLHKIWKWKEEYGGVILGQQKAMGASPDWNYFLFTMDQAANDAVKKFFVDLYNEGLIYQSDYIVHWDPVLQSAISDAEVEHKETKGAFYHIKYMLKNPTKERDHLEVATTRPETLLGDSAVAVHPNDERYKHLIGQTVILPLCKREIPIIADEHVDLEVGTACLKVTPGHDFNDFDIGRRHKLPIHKILAKDGKLNSEYGMEWAGMTCKKAREAIVKRLEEEGLLVHVKDHVHQVGHSQRTEAIVEPMVSKQWFLNVQKMAQDAVKAVESNEMSFWPKGWENTYYSWLREPRDWCISRQLWWGHQIPVFYCEKCKHQWASEEDHPKTCPKCHAEAIHQDPDVLDTWFSSGLWPLSQLGWPNKERMAEKRFDEFYPTSCLVTGFDIIFFWVARMMMMGIKVTGKAPFKHTYIHAIVRDKQGRKMSKSLGNGIDPLEMIDQYGTDAFRFTLAAGSGYNRGLNLDPERIGGYRNFINKIWNAFRFIHPFLAEAQTEMPKAAELTHHERWIISELNSVIKEMNSSMEEYRFDDACASLYSFVYDKYCSWFIELSKNVLHGDDVKARAQRATVLRHCFRKVVALLHPFSPYISEELWSHIKNENDDLLIVTEYPEFDASLEFAQDQNNMNKFVEVVTLIRNLRASVNVKPKDEVAIHLFSDHADLQKYFKASNKDFTELARVKELHIEPKSAARPPKAIMLATTHTEVFLPLEGVIDLGEYTKKLEKELTKTEADYGRLEVKLKNENFMKNAPPEVSAEVRKSASDLQEKIQALKNNLKDFKN